MTLEISTMELPSVSVGEGVRIRADVLVTTQPGKVTPCTAVSRPLLDSVTVSQLDREINDRLEKQGQTTRLQVVGFRFIPLSPDREGAESCKILKFPEYGGNVWKAKLEIDAIVVHNEVITLIVLAAIVVAAAVGVWQYSAMKRSDNLILQLAMENPEAARNLSLTQQPTVGEGMKSLGVGIAVAALALAFAGGR